MTTSTMFESPVTYSLDRKKKTVSFGDVEIIEIPADNRQATSRALSESIRERYLRFCTESDFPVFNVHGRRHVRLHTTMSALTVKLTDTHLYQTEILFKQASPATPATPVTPVSPMYGFLVQQWSI